MRIATVIQVSNQPSLPNLGRSNHWTQSPLLTPFGGFKVKGANNENN